MERYLKEDEDERYSIRKGGRKRGKVRIRNRNIIRIVEKELGVIN